MKASHFPGNCNPSALGVGSYTNFAPATNYLTKLLQLEMGMYYLVWAALRLSSDPPQLYDDFLKLLGNDVTYATLNYDMLLETIFRRNQCAWYYPMQGETRIDHNELESFDGSFYTTPDENPQSIPYLKLHGSCNWYYCWRCGYFGIVRDPNHGVVCKLLREGRPSVKVGHFRACGSDACEEMRGAADGGAVYKPLIIPPARMKEYSQAPVLRHWAFLDLLLSQAQEIILVGTSVRDDDVLLVNSLNLLGRKNNNPLLKSITVINRDCAVAKKVERLTEVDTRCYENLETYLTERLADN
jgi:hypothetical protein